MSCAADIFELHLNDSITAAGAKPPIPELSRIPDIVQVSREDHTRKPRTDFPVGFATGV
jgi:hypothetical protein